MLPFHRSQGRAFPTEDQLQKPSGHSSANDPHPKTSKNKNRPQQKNPERARTCSREETTALFTVLPLTAKQAAYEQRRLPPFAISERPCQAAIPASLLRHTWPGHPAPRAATPRVEERYSKKIYTENSDRKCSLRSLTSGKHNGAGSVALPLMDAKSENPVSAHNNVPMKIRRPRVNWQRCPAIYTIAANTAFNKFKTPQQ